MYQNYYLRASDVPIEYSKDHKPDWSETPGRVSAWAVKDTAKFEDAVLEAARIGHELRRDSSVIYVKQLQREYDGAGEVPIYMAQITDSKGNTWEQEKDPDLPDMYGHDNDKSPLAREVWATVENNENAKILGAYVPSLDSLVWL